MSVRLAIGDDFVEARGDADFEKKAVEEFLALWKMMIDKQRQYADWLERHNYNQETQRMEHEIWELKGKLRARKHL